eukprot:CAMPEP_0195075126 /NCGR_PEP_ID=MMETSP0448-20130528/18073_1 /TAXON_ID=66468 /ORGANISM="Heterocapsa triquestra, Strain CCMP 448" /LENGTH=95 /DNA_ID=CAMNT_0040107471 /DNA_START=59 /DNA_END=342 /DNA_ORIENTATION=+
MQQLSIARQGVYSLHHRLQKREDRRSQASRPGSPRAASGALSRAGTNTKARPLWAASGRGGGVGAARTRHAAPSPDPCPCTGGKGWVTECSTAAP